MISASPSVLSPSTTERHKLRERGGLSAARCYQCGTCTSACDLASGDSTFPRRQMLLAQWGLVHQLTADPSVWLCHQCNDCTARCPRDAKPGDVMQTARALVIEQLAVPRFMGRLVAKVKTSWPLLLGLPIAFWALFVGLVGGFSVAQPPYGHGAFAYELFVPHWMIYAVFFPVSGLVALALTVSGVRYWRGLDGAENRSGSIVSHLTTAFAQIATHSRFSSCTTAGSRRWWHFSLIWGFVGAAITSGLLIVAIYGMNAVMPLSMLHPIKILGNLSAVLLVVGSVMLLLNRMTRREETGASTAFDTFFLGVVVLVIITGVVIELWRLVLPPEIGAWLYIVHLGSVLCLFVTTPYSKFSHLLYRTLAMVHESMTTAARPQGEKTATSVRTTPSPVGES